MIRRPMMALGLLALIATPVLAAGLWPNFPLVGSASFCSSTNTAGVPGTASVCTTTTPAGPSIVSGLETIPADTHKANGASPQTVNLGLASLNALPLTYVDLPPITASAGGLNSFTGTVLQGGVIFSSTGSLSPTTVWLPASPIDGQQFRISSNGTIGTLSVLGNGAAIANTPTVLTVSTTGSFGYQFKYRSSNATWYRLD